MFNKKIAFYSACQAVSNDTSSTSKSNQIKSKYLFLQLKSYKIKKHITIIEENVKSYILIQNSESQNDEHESLTNKTKKLKQYQNHLKCNKFSEAETF